MHSNLGLFTNATLPITVISIDSARHDVPCLDAGFQREYKVGTAGKPINMIRFLSVPADYRLRRWPRWPIVNRGTPDFANVNSHTPPTSLQNSPFPLDDFTHAGPACSNHHSQPNQTDQAADVEKLRNSADLSPARDHKAPPHFRNTWNSCSHAAHFFSQTRTILIFIAQRPEWYFLHIRFSDRTIIIFRR